MSQPKKNEVDVVLERLKRILNLRHDAELAEQLGINRQRLSKYRTRNSMPYSIIMPFLEKSNVSADFVFFGRDTLSSPDDVSNKLLKAELMLLKGDACSLFNRVHNLYIRINS